MLSGRAVQARRGEGTVQRHVERGGFDASDGQDLFVIQIAELGGVGLLEGQLREEPVVVPAALTNPVSLFIHAQSGHKHQAERHQRREMPAFAHRFPQRCPRTLRELDARFPARPAQLVLRLTHGHDDVVPGRDEGRQQHIGARLGWS